MITIIKEGKTPTYELECCECGTVFRFHKVDIDRVDNNFGYVRCPLCGWFNRNNKAKVIEVNNKNEATT